MSYITMAGGSGFDRSVNPAAIPLAGYQAAALLTIAVNPRRNYLEIQNQSASMLQVVLDDGAGGTATSILLASGGAANTQGGSWDTQAFKGRVRVFSVNVSDQVSGYET